MAEVSRKWGRASEKNPDCEQCVGVSFSFVSERGGPGSDATTFLSLKVAVVLAIVFLVEIEKKESEETYSVINLSQLRTKTLLSLQLKSLLVPSPYLFVSVGTTYLAFLQRSYISHPHNGSMAPTHIRLHFPTFLPH